MNSSPADPSADPARGRRWFVILAIVTLVGFAVFVGTITVLALRIPKLERPRFGVLKGGEAPRSH